MIVIFDLDGTLLNTIDDLGYACNYALERTGFPTHRIENYPQMVGNGINNLIRRALPETERTEENILRVREFFVPYYNAHNCDYTRPYNGIPQLLATLKAQGHQLAVASNKYQAATEKIVEHFFPGVFDVILGEHHSNSIVGSWISEYAIDDSGERFDIPDQIKVSFDFYEDHTGEYGYSTYSNHNIIIDYIDLTWEQQFNRLYLWFDDGEHEELYYTINEDGYLLLSLNAQLTQYTAYCPVDHEHPLGGCMDSYHSDRAATIKSVSRVVDLGK